MELEAFLFDFLFVLFVWCFVGFFFPFSGKEQGYPVKKPLEQMQCMEITHNSCFALSMC